MENMKNNATATIKNTVKNEGENTMTREEKQKQAMQVINNAAKIYGGDWAKTTRSEMKQASNFVPALKACLDAERAKQEKTIASANKKLAKLEEEKELTEKIQAEITVTKAKIEIAENRKTECLAAFESLSVFNAPMTQFAAIWTTGAMKLKYDFENREQVKAIASALQELYKDYPATVDTIANGKQYKGDVYKKFKSYLQDFYNIVLPTLDGKPVYVKQCETAALIGNCVTFKLRGDKNMNVKGGYVVHDVEDIIIALCTVLVGKLEGKFDKVDKADNAPVGSEQSVTAIIK